MTYHVLFITAVFNRHSTLPYIINMFKKIISALLISVTFCSGQPSVAAKQEVIDDQFFEKWFSGAQSDAVNNPEKVRSLAKKISLALQSQGSENAYRAYYVVALTYRSTNDYKTSSEYLRKALNLIDKNQSSGEYVRILREIGVDYESRNDVQKAVEYYSQALNFSKSSNLEACTQNLVSMGLARIFSSIDDHAHALELIKPILDNKECELDEFIYAHELAGKLYYKLNDFQRSLEHHQILLKKLPNDFILYRANARLSLALTLIELGHKDEAVNEITFVEKQQIEHNLNIAPSQIEWARAKWYAASGDTQKAYDATTLIFSSLDDHSGHLKMKIEHVVLPFYIDLAIKLGKVNRANELLLRFQKHSEAYFSIQKAAILGLNEAKLNVARRDGEISFLNQQARENELKRDRLILALMLFFVGGWFLLGFLMKARRDNAQNQQLNKMLESYAQKTLAESVDATARLEKERTLFQESHHRFKNNLHLLTSILETQHQKLRSGAQQSMPNFLLLEVINRVQAMAIIHQYANSDPNLDGVSIKKMLSNVVEQTVGIIHNAVEVNLQCSDLAFDHETSKSLVLIVNELLCNAQKYAFNEHGGRVNIRLFEMSDSKYCLIVEDNGKGIPNGLFDHGYRSVGLSLVNSLVDQIRGELVLDPNHQGTKWIINF